MTTAPPQAVRRVLASCAITPCTLRVDLPGPWSNPFQVGWYCTIGRGRGYPDDKWTMAKAGWQEPDAFRVESHEHSLKLYRLMVERYPYGEDWLAQIRGKNLACTCPLDQPCHADVLLELANAPHPARKIVEGR